MGTPRPFSPHQPIRYQFGVSVLNLRSFFGWDTPLTHIQLPDQHFHLDLLKASQMQHVWGRTHDSHITASSTHFFPNRPLSSVPNLCEWHLPVAQSQKTKSILTTSYPLTPISNSLLHTVDCSTLNSSWTHQSSWSPLPSPLLKLSSVFIRPHNSFVCSYAPFLFPSQLSN